MIIGGVAASVLGRPRLTQDVDALAVLPDADWAEAVRLAPQYRILPRIEDALQFAQRSRVLLMRHTTSGIDVDVTFGELPFERAAVANCENHDVGGVRVRLPRVEDLLVMKAIARRPRMSKTFRDCWPLTLSWTSLLRGAGSGSSRPP